MRLALCVGGVGMKPSHALRLAMHYNHFAAVLPEDFDDSEDVMQWLSHLVQMNGTIDVIEPPSETQMQTVQGCKARTRILASAKGA
jgi:hypothetical protein